MLSARSWRARAKGLTAVSVHAGNDAHSPFITRAVRTSARGTRTNCGLRDMLSASAQAKTKAQRPIRARGRPGRGRRRRCRCGAGRLVRSWTVKSMYRDEGLWTGAHSCVRAREHKLPAWLPGPSSPGAYELRAVIWYCLGAAKDNTNLPHQSFNRVAATQAAHARARRGHGSGRARGAEDASAKRRSWRRLRRRAWRACTWWPSSSSSGCSLPCPDYRASVG